MLPGGAIWRARVTFGGISWRLRIAAKEAWRKGDLEYGRFQLPPTDNAEFIPLPER